MDHVIPYNLLQGFLLKKRTRILVFLMAALLVLAAKATYSAPINAASVLSIGSIFALSVRDA
jgi:hypothetical protein